MEDDFAAYLPTEDEIAAACEKIRAGWPPGEHRRRQGGYDTRRAQSSAVPAGWLPPMISVTPEVAAALGVA